MMMKTNTLLLGLAATAGLAVGTSASAATIFVTNTSGNAAGLNGAVATTVTPLTLSAADGGGTLNLTTESVLLNAAASSLGMDATTLGVNGDKFGINNGNPQTWVFSFDQTLSFDGFTLIDESANINQDSMIISSAAWIGNTVTDGTNWSFDSVTGTITTDKVPTSSTGYDFTGAGLANVTAGTSITIAFDTVDAGNGGVGLQDFTVTVIPEPGSLALLGLGGLLVARRRRG